MKTIRKKNSQKTFSHLLPAGIALLSVSVAFLATARGGTELKWADVPETVRATVRANGGTTGQAVDDEGKKINGKAIYEASVKDKAGNTADLVIAEDGKLIETKHDDADDAAVERADRAKKLLADVKFNHPRDITNPFLPLATLKQDIIEGSEGGKKTRVERTAMPQKHRTFTVNGEEVDTLIVEDRAYEDGKLSEVALDYFAQDDNGTVYYFGEDVDEYQNGKIVSHEGSWLLGKDTPVPGVLFPAQPKVGQKFNSEDVSKEISEADEIVSVSETMTVPAGTFKDCVKTKEVCGDGSVEYKYYAKGVGVVREVPSSGDELLISHATH